MALSAGCIPQAENQVIYGGDMTTFCIESLYENHKNPNILIYRGKYIQANLDLRNSIFPFLNRELFDSEKIYVP